MCHPCFCHQQTTPTGYGTSRTSCHLLCNNSGRRHNISRQAQKTPFSFESQSQHLLPAVEYCACWAPYAIAFYSNSSTSLGAFASLEFSTSKNEVELGQVCRVSTHGIGKINIQAIHSMQLLSFLDTHDNWHYVSDNGSTTDGESESAFDFKWWISARNLTTSSTYIMIVRSSDNPNLVVDMNTRTQISQEDRHQRIHGLAGPTSESIQQQNALAGHENIHFNRGLRTGSRRIPQSPFKS